MVLASRGELGSALLVVGMLFTVQNGGRTAWYDDTNVLFNQLQLTAL